MLVAEYVARFLVAQKIKKCFVISGGASIHLLHALERTEGIDPVCPHHEQAAAMAADGYARDTQNFGVAVGTSGPGATNLITGIAGAWFDSVPALFFTGQVTTFRLKKGSGVRQFGFQETEIVPMLQPICKYVVQIKRAEDIRIELEKALYYMFEGRPGPVTVDLPDDIQRQDINPDALEGFTKPEPTNTKASELSDLSDIQRAINEAKRPVVIAGWGVRLSKSTDALLSLCEKWGVPLLTSWAMKDMIAHDHPLNAGVFGTHGTRSGNFTVQNADLLLSFGARLSTRETGSPLSTWAREAKTIVVDIDENELAKFKVFGKPLDFEIQSDAKVGIEAFDTQLSISSDFSAWSNQTATWKAKYGSNVEPSEPTGTVNPYNFIDTLSSQTTEGTHIYIDTGCAIAWTMQEFKVKARQRLFHDFNNTAMGWAIPACIGAASSEQAERYLAITGDGSFMMNLQELATLVHHQFDIGVILLDNAGYSMVRQTEEQWLNGKNVGTSTQSGLSFPNYEILCRAFSLKYFHIKQAGDVAQTVSDFMQAKGPRLLHAQIPEDARVIPQVTYGYPIEDSEPFLPREEFMENMIVTPMPASL